MSPRTSLALAAILVALPTLAQEQRPDEADLFGGETSQQEAPFPAEEEQPPQQPPPAPEGAEEGRDSQALGGTPPPDAFASAEAVDDPLKIGGRFYLRALTQANEGVSFGDTSFSAPTQIDTYLDARPAERLRGFVLGRLSFDPTRLQGSSNPLQPSTSNVAAAPTVLLDQAWLRFDIERQVFITAGKQHVKWGTASIWNPTDFLSPQRRNPLEFIDVRTGASMLKVHVPWEATGWNFYAIGLLDNAGPANTLGEVGGAARAELVFGETEVAASGVLVRGRKPRFGLDFSSGLGPFDVYGELALQQGTDQPLFRLPEGVSIPDLIEDIRNSGRPPDLAALPIERYYPEGLTPQASAGLRYEFAYAENELATVGVEYFFNSTGYPTELAYPYLLFQGQFQPFFLGQHYAALYAFLLGPGSWDDTSLFLFNLGNLSDRSFITRLNVTQRVLRFLTVEAFAAVNYGRKGGEFRFALDLPAFQVGGQPVPPTVVRAPTVQLGVGLRIDI